MTPEQQRDSMRRKEECDFWRGPDCALVNKLLGWMHAMTLDECGGCLRLGPDTTEARLYRETYALLTVLPNVVKALETQPQRVQLTVFQRHLKGPERPAMLRRLAPHVGPGVAARLAKIAGVDYAPIHREFFEGKSDQEIAAGMSQHARNAATRPVWERIAAELDAGGRQAHTPSVLQRPVLLAKALASGRNASDEDLDLRHISCYGTDLNGRRVKDPCPSLTLSRGLYYCADCGCGENALTRLDEKLLFKELPCPRQMPGFSNVPLTIGGEAVPA